MHMSESTKQSSKGWSDPDDVDVEWTEEMFEAAAVYRGEKMLRPAKGKLGLDGIIPLEPGDSARGRPPKANPKKQVTLRLDPDVLEKFRATGKGWQSRINRELRKALGI